MTKQNPWIDVYPFGKAIDFVDITPTGEVLEMNPELSKFSEECWKPKKEKGYKSSWIPLVKKINTNAGGDPCKEGLAIRIDAGVMTYAQTNGCLQAIKQGKSFAPEAINNLSIGIIPITKDRYAMVSRRALDIDHAPGVWNFNGGYMTSLLIDSKNCDDPKFITDPSLFDIYKQINSRIHKQEFQGLKEIVGKDEEGDFKLEKFPDSLAFGFYHSLEMEIGWIADFKKTKKEMMEHIREYEIAGGKKEHSEVQFIPIEELETLVLNQPKLLNEDPVKYNSDDPRKLILLDDNIGELVGGSLSKILKRADLAGETGKELSKKLNESGLNVKIHKAGEYEFPTYF